jgi:hypothetical protein
MKYLLDENEYEIFVESRQNSNSVETMKSALESARDYMLEKADYICVHNRKERYVGYCDGRPCSPLDHNDYQTWKIICGKETAYGK